MSKHIRKKSKKIREKNFFVKLSKTLKRENLKTKNINILSHIIILKN